MRKMEITPVSSVVENGRSASAFPGLRSPRLTISNNDDRIFPTRRRGIGEGGIDGNEVVRHVGLDVEQARARERSLKGLEVEVAVAEDGVC